MLLPSAAENLGSLPTNHFEMVYTLFFSLGLHTYFTDIKILIIQVPNYHLPTPPVTAVSAFQGLRAPNQFSLLDRMRQ